MGRRAGMQGRLRSDERMEDACIDRVLDFEQLDD